MFISDLQSFIDDAPYGSEIGIVVKSIETGAELFSTYDVVADIDEYGELLICIAIEAQPYGY
jgi:hypothetical protein